MVLKSLGMGLFFPNLLVNVHLEADFLRTQNRWGCLRKWTLGGLKVRSAEGWLEGFLSGQELPKSGPVAQPHRDSGGKIRRIKYPDVQCHDKSIFEGWNFGRLATDNLSLNSLFLRKGLRNACLAFKETFNIGKWQEPQWHGKVATNQTSGGHSISAPHFIAHLKPVWSKNSGENPKNCPQWRGRFPTSGP